MSQAVHDMFADIAPNYDRANDVLSFGIHRLWRDKALQRAGLNPESTLVDVCTGTGDVAFAAARRLSAKGQVIGIDFVYPMLAIAEKKARQQGAAPVHFIHGDALHLPLPDSCADAVIVSFGIRNVDDPIAGLKEMLRVVRPGGAVVVLEFGQPLLPGFSLLYRYYSKYLMPIIGGLLTGNRSAYEYLPETAERFPAGKRFVALMQEAGLKDAEYQALLAGLAYMYWARK